MFSLPTIIMQLYPGKTEEEIQAISDACLRGGANYYHRTWKEVKKEDLGKEEVILNLIRTIHTSQHSYWGGVDEIMRSLEEWSDGIIIFEGLNKEQNEFYQRFYCFIGFLNFAYIEFKRKLFLLESRFLVLACIWEIPVYVNVQLYFSRYAFVEGMRNDAILMADSIERNWAPVGEEGRAELTVEEWVRKFNEKPFTNFGGRIDDYFVDNLEVNRFDQGVQNVLRKIFTLYWGLRSGSVWREISEDLHIAGYENKKVRENKTADQYYLQMLQEADKEGFLIWLTSYDHFVDWVLAVGKSDEFMNQLFYILTQKVDLDDVEELGYFVDLMEALQKNEWSLGSDLVYYDEETSGFRWNQDIIEALKEEVEYVKLYGEKPRPQVLTMPEKLDIKE